MAGPSAELVVRIQVVALGLVVALVVRIQVEEVVGRAAFVVEAAAEAVDSQAVALELLGAEPSAVVVARELGIPEGQEPFEVLVVRLEPEAVELQ